jgi:hypothetical protein
VRVHVGADPNNHTNDYVVPNEFLRFGRRRRDPYRASSTDERFMGVYITRQQWIETDGTVRQLLRGDTIHLDYFDIDNPNTARSATLLFPSQRPVTGAAIPPVEPTTLGLGPSAASLGPVRLQVAGTGGGNGNSDPGALVPTDEYLNFPRPAMTSNRGSGFLSVFGVTNGVIFVPSSYRGRLEMFDFRNGP